MLSILTSIQTGNPIGEYSTILYSPGAEDSFYAKAVADDRGTITFWGSGKIKTAFNTAVVQRVVVTRNDYTTPWYMVSATGTTTGMTGTPAANEVAFSTKDSSYITVSLENDFNKVCFEEVFADNIGIRVAESVTSKGTAIILGNDNTGQASKQLGHSVVFYSLHGTPIDAQSDILSGSGAIKPVDPTSEGYTFASWYTSMNYNTIWDFNTPITEDIQLFAKWTENASSSNPNTPANPNQPSSPSSSGGSDSYDPTYSISVPSGLTGGKVSVTPTSASVGQRVTVTVKPNHRLGYVVLLVVSYVESP